MIFSANFLRDQRDLKYGIIIRIGGRQRWWRWRVGCHHCDDAEWVCENHPDKPWEPMSFREDACGCGAGIPCAVCNELSNRGHQTARERILERTRQMRAELQLPPSQALGGNAR